jgi:ribonuclease Z
MVNVTKKATWTRRAALPDDANFCRPVKKKVPELFDLGLTNMTVNFPNPRNSIYDIEGAVPCNVKFNPRLRCPTAVYRKPSQVFPKNFRVDLKKMDKDRLVQNVKNVLGDDE